jgi:hypothetical protein
MVGAYLGGRGTIGIEVELTLFDPVLHIATRAVELLVKVFGFAFGAGERSHDEARIGLALGKLSLGNNPPFPAPITARLVPEIFEAPRRLLGPPAPRLGTPELAFDVGKKPRILG